MIELRDYTLDDAKALAENADNPQVVRYLREVFSSPVKGAKRCVSVRDRLGDRRNFAIDYTGQFVGGASLQFQQNENRYSCELGYWLGEKHWGKGIASIAVAKLKDIAFSEYDVKRLYGPVAGGNDASMRVLEKNGFVLEGVLKDNLFLRGELYDEYIYAAYTEAKAKDDLRRRLKAGYKPKWMTY